MFKHLQHWLLPLLAVVPLATVLGCAATGSTGTTNSTGTTSSTGTGTGVSPASSFPLTVDAADGRVTIRRRPTAIISLSPTATEMLYSIGAGKQVKAVDDDSNYPKGVPTTKLSGLDPNIESIASYKPDLVIVSYETPSLNHALNTLGIPVLYEPAATGLSEEYHQFSQLGAVTGHLAAADAEVAEIKGEIKQIVASTPKPSRPETYYYELDQTYYSETSTTFIGKLLGLFNLRSIADSAKGAAAAGGYPQLNPGFILHSNPDYIFLADTVCCHQSAASVAARPGWSALSAVKEHRVLGLNDSIASRWGPRIVILLRDVSSELRRHPVGKP